MLGRTINSVVHRIRGLESLSASVVERGQIVSVQVAEKNFGDS